MSPQFQTIIALAIVAVAMGLLVRGALRKKKTRLRLPGQRIENKTRQALGLSDQARARVGSQARCSQGRLRRHNRLAFPANAGASEQAALYKFTR
jgi:hypothetical protein